MNQILTDLVEEIWMLGVKHEETTMPQMEKSLKEYTDKLAAAIEDIIGSDEATVAIVTETTHPRMSTGIHNDKPAKIRNSLREQQRERLQGGQHGTTR